MEVARGSTSSQLLLLVPAKIAAVAPGTQLLLPGLEVGVNPSASAVGSSSGSAKRDCMTDSPSALADHLVPRGLEEVGSRRGGRNSPVYLRAGFVLLFHHGQQVSRVDLQPVCVDVPGSTVPLRDVWPQSPHRNVPGAERHVPIASRLVFTTAPDVACPVRDLRAVATCASGFLHRNVSGPVGDPGVSVRSPPDLPRLNGQVASAVGNS
eukprot:CAMPEP_0114551384 /NCGR_PEP_ID=MMETSP0114-20121206/6579_1 /TAXON_ID=31324 /ORGANISM="Goniomonas sp, Strain m" /LENGTH=208 /DNA_ID=CAMNT_0001736223 /DNA_START=661 /DNA_END=1284 /DNA_ORIENTATION=-